ncbi:glycosyltransferase family 4 protein, partial [Acidobacteriota bacterium]
YHGELKLLFVGRATPVKGIPLIFEAVKNLVDEYGISCYITLVGTGNNEYTRSLQHTMQQSCLKDRVTFLEWMDKDKLEPIYLDHHIFIHPHLKPTSFPNSLLEAMKFGLPVITTSLGGPAEFIKHKKTGFLIEPGDIKAISKTIYLLATQPGLPEHISSNAYKYLEDNLDFINQSEKYEKVIRDMVRDS